MTITDINDHSPVFEQASPVRLNIVEHSQPPGSFLTDLHATDEDVGTNAHIRYSITAGNDNSESLENHIDQIMHDNYVRSSLIPSFNWYSCKVIER